MIENKNHSQILALAAIFQACGLIYQLGMKGSCDDSPFETSIQSIYRLESPDFDSIFGKRENLRYGLELLVELLTQKSKSKEQITISRYVFDVMFLQHKLMKKTDTLDYLRRRIKHAVTQRQYFSEINDTIIENLADIYVNSISQFHYKVQLIGKAHLMKNPKNFNKMRALLLSGIRASVLWQQLGGKRYQLLFSRKKILQQAQQYLEIIS